jgi:DNA-directed RNA polymerase specialized sigma subunit
MIEQYMKEVENLIKFKANEAHKTLLPNWSIDDLEQEGRVAALRAYKKFNKKQNVLFTTFIFPYLTRTYLSIYAYETCSKRSIKKQLVKDAKEMEEKKVIFPSSYKKGTIYNLDRIFQGNKLSNDSFSGWNEQPVLSEPQLQVKSGAEDFEICDVLKQISKKLDSISKRVLELLVSPPNTFVSEKLGKSNQEYCRYLNITPHKLNKCKRLIKKEVLRVL